MSLQSIAKKFRKPSQNVSPLFYTRWSPRAMKGKLTSKELNHYLKRLDGHLLHLMYNRGGLSLQQVREKTFSWIS